MGDDKIGRAVLEITVDDKQYKFAMDEVGKKADETAEHIRGISELLHTEAFLEFGKIAFEAVSKVAEGIVELGERGTQVQEVSAGFASLSLSAHSTADVMLGALREGVQGTVSDFDLMKVGAKVLGTGVIQTGDQMKLMAEGAKMLADRTGTDLPGAFDALSKSMITGRTNGLKQLGLFVDSKAATLAFAEAHGKTVETLTGAEKAMAVTNATLNVLRTQLGEGGSHALKFGEMVEQAKAAFQNFHDQLALGVSISPVLMAGMQAAGAAIARAFGPQQKGIIELIITTIEKLAIAVGYLAEYAVDGAQIIDRVWMGLKVTFNELAVVVTTGLGAITGGYAAVAEAGARLTGNSALKVLAHEARAASDDLKALSKGFEKNAADAIISSNAEVAGLEKVKGVVRSVTDAMIQAQGKVGHSAAEVAKPVAGIGEAMEHAAARSKEATHKIEDEIMALKQAIILNTKEGLDKRLQEIANAEQTEIAKLRELKGITATEYSTMEQLIRQKYAQMAAAAKVGTDKIKETHRKLEQDVLLLTKSGVDKRLAELDFEEVRQLQDLEYLKQNYNSQYTQMAALVKQKFDKMRADASGAYRGMTAEALQMGFRTRADLQQSAANALRLFNEMKQSHEYTTAEMTKQWENYEKAKQEATEQGKVYQKATLDDLAQAASGFLTSVFGKSKAAAIAGAVIDLAAAVLKTFKTFGWPAGIPMAAAMTAAGLAQIAKIKSQSFKVGTPGLDFQDFGAEAPSFLHGHEAVIPRGGGHQLAGEIASSMRARDAIDNTKHLKGLRDDIQNMHRMLKQKVVFGTA